jgi:hypothetical protein
MSITLNQAWSNAGTNTANNVPLAYGAIPAAGDLLIAVFSLTDTQTLTSLADTIGDGVSWVQAGTTVHDNNSGSNSYVYYKTVGTPSGGAKTVTLTASATAGMVLSIAAYRSSVAGTWSTDGFVSVINTTSTNPSPGAITTTAADGVVLGYVVKSGATPTAGTGFTLQSAPTGYFGYEGVEDRITTAAGSYTAAWVDGASSTWSTLGSAFKWVTGAPAITAQPISTTVATGSSSIIFSVTATGATSYQWQRMPSGGSFADIGGATSSSYTTGTVTNATNNLDQYRCNVTNASGTTASSAATLTVYATTTAAYTIEGDLCGMGAMASAPFSTVKLVATSGGAAALAGTASCLAASAATATTSIKLAGAAAAVSTGVASMGTPAAALAATPMSLAASTGGLSTAIVVMAASSASASVTGALTTAIRLTISALVQAAATAAITTSIALSGGALAQASGTGTLATGIRLAASPVSVATGSATFAATAAALASDSFAISLSTGALSTGINLSASSAVVATGSATFATTAAALASDSFAISLSTGALTTGINLSASSAVVATGSATFATTAAALASSAISASSATGALSTGINLATGTLSQAISTGALTTQIPLSAISVAQAAATGSLSQSSYNLTLTIAQAQRLEAVWRLHGLSSPLVVTPTSRSDGVVAQTLSGVGPVTVTTTAMPTGQQPLASWVDDMARWYGLIDPMVEQDASRTDGTLSQTVVTAGGITTVTTV